MASRGLEKGFKGASRGLEKGLKVACLKGASRGLEKGFKGASRRLQALLTFVPPPGRDPSSPLEGYLRRWWLGSSPLHVVFIVILDVLVAQLVGASFLTALTDCR